ncbi:IS66 family transposase [Desulfovibrio sp. An276]|uniref:IS66 family transposase n=1 Tax=Desulfovibrio sp. An276 TaxID=1965618 RepID=UPI0013A62451|nr:transposase [Desulfovibrio sp. An276]
MAGVNEMRVKGLINLFKKRDDCLGTLARRLEKDGVSLYTFLRIAGVEPTNNVAERALRAIVVKRKCAFGSISEAGFRWLKRSFSFKQTCRQHEWPYF